MANTSGGGTQTGDKPANTSLSTEIRSYLLKVRNIENAETLNLLRRAKQVMSRVAASDRKSVGSPSVWRRRKHFWPKFRSVSGSGSKFFFKSDPL